MTNTIELRFYEELNDFLSPDKRRQPFPHTLKGRASIKDIIESLGVPHTEVDLILVNGVSVDFNYIPDAQDQISVYPVFESFDIAPIIHLRAKPLRETKFILDVHLGKLARRLRLLGFDVLFSNKYSDQDLIQISLEERRIILTRDINLLKNKVITHGYWIRNIDPSKQLKEVITRFHLESKVEPFIRCLKCNGMLNGIQKDGVKGLVPEQIEQQFDHFNECIECHKIYWEGSHYDKLKNFIKKFLEELK